MAQTILSALAPIVFTLLLGFVAAWRHDFGPKEASVLNRMVLWFNLLSRFLNGCRVPLETTDKIGTRDLATREQDAMSGFFHMSEIARSSNNRRL